MEMRIRTYLELDQVEQLEETATNLRDRLLIRLLFRLGCRVSEALALEVKDIDLANQTVSITHLKIRLKLKCRQCQALLSLADLYCARCGSRIDKATKELQEKRRQRVLPIGGELATAIKEYFERGGPVNRGGKRLLFGINRHRAWQIIKECAKKAGLPQLINPETGKVHNISPHRLRDAFAVYAVKCNDTGDGLRMLQEHLGHASFNTTARYRKVAGEEHRKWYDSLWGKNDTGG